MLLICSQWVRRILLTDSHLDIEKLSHDGLTPLDVARKSGTDDGWLEPEPRIIEVRWIPTCWLLRDRIYIDACVLLSSDGYSGCILLETEVS